MHEITGDLWATAVELKADAVVITTNGIVNKDGTAVMGRGVAREAADAWPTLPAILGRRIREVGNHVHHLGFVNLANINVRVLALPVKHNWWEKADLVLIVHSVMELTQMASDYAMQTVVLPRPGCGNGGLEWADVQRVIKDLLDDRFIVVYCAGRIR